MWSKENLAMNILGEPVVEDVFLRVYRGIHTGREISEEHLHYMIYMHT